MAMRPKEAITEIWRRGFFEGEPKSGAEIAKRIKSDYGVTTANITAVLNNCKEFLRREGKGWTQRMRYDGAERAIGKKIDYFTLLNIHPRVKKASQKLFLDGHYPMAIFEGFKQVEIMVKEKTKIRDKYGVPLMQEVFSANNPILRLNGNTTDSDEDEQKGFMMLFSGAILGVRDPRGHSDMIQNDPIITLQYLCFASILCRMIDKSTKVR